MENSKFQFKGFTIARSLIERNEDAEPGKKLSLSFSPKGFFNVKKLSYQLRLGINLSSI